MLSRESTAQLISDDPKPGSRAELLAPYLVAGAGGYHNLHAIMKVNGEKLVTPTQFQDKAGEVVTLEKYSDDNHGFLRLEVSGSIITGRYYTVPRPQDPYSKGSSLLDYFEYDWKAHQYNPNKLVANGATIPMPRHR